MSWSLIVIFVVLSGAVVLLRVRAHRHGKRLARLEYEMADIRREWRLGR